MHSKAHNMFCSSLILIVLMYTDGYIGTRVEHLSERIFKLERRVMEDINLLRREFYAELQTVHTDEHGDRNPEFVGNNTINTTVIEDKLEALVDILGPIGQLRKGFHQEKIVVRSVKEEVQCLKDHLGEVHNDFKAILSTLSRHISELLDPVKTQGIETQSKIQAVLKDIDVKMSINMKYADCSDLLRAGYSTSGIYTIYPDTLWRSLKVYCDMETSGGGWTVFQRRQDGSVIFERLWLEYVYGFGNLDGEFWLGNDFLHKLTSRGPHELCIELEDFDNDVRIAKYGLFSIGSESDLFKLSVASFTGNVSDDLSSVHNGHQFSTKDKGPATGCSKSYKGGFWYNKCHLVNINGQYLKGEHESFADGVNWKGFRGYHYSLKRTEMKFRPR